MPLCQSCTQERTWEAEGLPVLHAAIDLPCPEASRRIRRFYALQSRAYLRYCQQFLLPRAEVAARTALEESRPFSPWEADLSWQCTYEEGSLLSLWVQSREAGDGVFYQRRGDTWDLAASAPVPLSCFLPRWWKRLFREVASAEMERRTRSGAAICRPDWQRQLRRTLNPRNFYLTEDGLTFFVPMYALGGAGLGIPTFTVPWAVLREKGSGCPRNRQPEPEEK